MGSGFLVKLCQNLVEVGALRVQSLYYKFSILELADAQEGFH